MAKVVITVTLEDTHTGPIIDGTMRAEVSAKVDRTGLEVPEPGSAAQWVGALMCDGMEAYSEECARIAMETHNRNVDRMRALREQQPSRN